MQQPKDKSASAAESRSLTSSLSLRLKIKGRGLLGRKRKVSAPELGSRPSATAKEASMDSRKLDTSLVSWILSSRLTLSSDHTRPAASP